MKPLLFLASALAMVAMAGCGDRPVEGFDPILHSEHGDQVLLDRAIRSLENDRSEEASRLLQTLMDAFPDSPLSPGVKSAMGNCLRNRECAPNIVCGGLTFFPNMESAGSPSEDVSPEERPSEDLSSDELLNRCMRYKD